MQREAPAYLRDVVEACDAIDAVLSGVEFDEYQATRMLRSSVKREFTIIGEAASVLSRTEPQLFARITNGRRIIDFRNQLTHAYLHVDDRIVWLIAQNDVPLLLAECEELLAEVGDADQQADQADSQAALVMYLGAIALAGYARCVSCTHPTRIRRCIVTLYA